MKKAKLVIALLVSSLILSGCATYKFHKGLAPYDKGYVASRDGFTILEYTIGKDASVPQDIDTAKQRFARRRKIVEHYYKQMGYIKNNFNKNIVDPFFMAGGILFGVFRLPSIAISDYKAEHSSAYREKIRKLEDEKDAKEEARINKFKEELGARIREN